MKFLILGLLICFYVAPSAAEITSSTKCGKCGDLRKIVAEFKKASAGADFDTLQLKATLVISKMPDKDKKLTDEQVKEVVEAFRVSVPKDSAGAIVTNNFEIVKANLPAIEKALSNVPAAEKEPILDAIAANHGEEEHGNDPASKPTPKK